MKTLNTVLRCSLVSWSVLFLCICGLAAEDTSSSTQRDSPLRVLILTMEEAGHSIPMLALGEALVSRGHQVTLLAVEVYHPAYPGSNRTMTNLRAWCRERGVEFASAGVLDLDLPNSPEDFGGIFKFASMIYKVSAMVTKAYDTMREAIVGKEHRLLQSADIVVLDVFFSHMLEWLGANTNLTVLSLTQTIPFSFSSLPSWYYPSLVRNPSRHPNPSISDRFVSTLVDAVFTVVYGTVGSFLKKLFPIDSKSGILAPDIAATAFGYDYPRPLYPMMHYVGPIVSSRDQTVDGELAAWLQEHSTPGSVVYFSMGSWAPVTASTAGAVVHGALELGYDVLWSLKNDSRRAVLEGIDAEYMNSSRVFVSGWLPQATVLKHPSISLAVLHGGFGGVNEALIAGVPIICLPVGGDQTMNCGRIQHQQLGIDFGTSHHISASDIKAAIQEIKNGKFGGNAQKVSKIFKKAGGASKAAELIEYYHEMGYDHLVPAWAKYNWTFVQYYNLDVYCVAGALVWVVVQAVRRARRACGRNYCSKLKTTKTE